MLKTNRDSTIELLRIVLIFMIIVQHLLIYSFKILDVNTYLNDLDFNSYTRLFLNSFLVVAVNTFILISGYYGIKFKWKTVFSLLSQVFFFSIVINLFRIIFDPVEWNWDYISELIFPISKEVWWFVTSYLGLYFLSPFLNAGIEQLDQKKLRLVILGLLIMNCFSGLIFGSFSEDGYTIFNFIVVYILGRYFQKYNIQIKYPGSFYILSAIVLFICILLAINFDKSYLINTLFQYNNFIIICSAIFLFYLFKNQNISYNKSINQVSGMVLGIYLLHDHVYVRIKIIEIVKHLETISGEQGVIFIFYLVLLVLTVFFSGVILGIIRIASVACLKNIDCRSKK